MFALYEFIVQYLVFCEIPLVSYCPYFNSNGMTGYLGKFDFLSKVSDQHVLNFTGSKVFDSLTILTLVQQNRRSKNSFINTNEFRNMNLSHLRDTKGLLNFVNFNQDAT
jgi:hypothetical protein